MGYLIKVATLFFALSLQLAYPTVMPLEVAGLLLLAAIYIVREKYNNHQLLFFGEAVMIILLSVTNPYYVHLFCSLAYDMACQGWYRWSLLLVLPAALFPAGLNMTAYVLLIIVSIIGGCQCHTLRQKEASFRSVYDHERQLRFALEEAKTKLLGAAREAAHLAEIKERNRIAREIHDNVGHQLAGILLQLQVAQKTLQRDLDKTETLLRQSVNGLAASVDLLRETVHNIKPKEYLGLDYLEKIIDNFKFCPVHFRHTGNFAILTPDQTEIITSIIREGLTNAAKYSQASLVEIKLDISAHLVRLYMKDNGIGCQKIHEGLGISGMKERVRYAGGQISISGLDGFLLVCVLPQESGGAIYESLNR